VPFPYYDRLSPRNKAIYRQSASVTEVRLPHAETLWPFIQELHAALEGDDRLRVQAVTNGLSRSLTRMLEIVPAEVQVLAVRPNAGWGELHGLYTQDDHRGARIQVWMRTAHHKRVVAFRTFLRTLLHEIGHHLDYHHLKLADSFHTEGFFRRESSLFRQLVPEAAKSTPRPR
jgi:hypothetical protein